MILKQPEYRLGVINTTFRTFLRRDPTTDEIDIWQQHFAVDSDNQEDLINTLVGSLEYYKQNGAVSQFETNSAPTNLVIDDVTGDSLKDLVLLDAGLDKVSIFRRRRRDGRRPHFDPTSFELQPAGRLSTGAWRWATSTATPSWTSSPPTRGPTTSASF